MASCPYGRSWSLACLSSPFLCGVELACDECDALKERDDRKDRDRDERGDEELVGAEHAPRADADDEDGEPDLARHQADRGGRTHRLGLRAHVAHEERGD